MNVIEQFGALSPQQCFDISAQHILKTRRRSANGQACTYGGTGCAARPFLNPSFVKRADEIGSWDRLRWADLVPPHNAQLIAELQSAHDNTCGGDEFFMEEWKTNMRDVAKKFSLSTELLDIDEDKK